MPNKKLSPTASNWINYMRAEKQRFPDLEHISRAQYYPYAAKGFKRWKKFFHDNYDSQKKYAIRSLISFFDQL